MNFTQAQEKLKSYGQEQVLKYFDELNDAEKEELLNQIAETDFSVTEMCTHKEKAAERGVITPLKAMELPEIEAEKKSYRKTGLDAIRAGKVGAVLLAGGMGTRLGSDAPKGMYNIGITKDVYIFERLICNLMKVVEEAGSYVPLFVMTSEKNHEATVGFFKEHDFFGYDKTNV